MTLSGINKQMGELPGMVQAGIEQASQQEAKIPEADLKEIKKSVKEAFQAAAITSAMSSEIKKGISEADAKKLLAWYESSLGKKITKAEEEASTPAAYQQMINEAQSLLADQERVAIAREIDRLVNATDLVMQLQEKTGIAVFTALSKAMEPAQPVNIAAFKAQMSAQEQQIRQNVEQLMIVSFVYSYKNIEIENLKKYVAFLARPETKKFNDSALTGMKSGLNQSIDKMANALAVTFSKQKKG